MFLTRLWRRQPGDWFCVSTNSSQGLWLDWFFARYELNEVQEWVWQNKDKNVYACPHGFSEPVRDKEHAVLPRLLWADLDRVDPGQLELMPTIAYQSSPGRYVGLWRTDRVVTEELNRRLTYHVGADKSGWDLTQFLRIVPGTYNFKYETTPLVRMLWDDGPTYRVKSLERDLPRLAATGGSRSGLLGPPPNVTRADGVKIARKHSLGMLYLGPCGNRSDVIFKIVRKLAEKGASPEEAFAVVMISKASERFDGDRHRAWRDVMRTWNKAT